MREIIMAEGCNAFKGDVKTFLRMNALFSKMGFKHVLFQQPVEDDMCHSELTLYIEPVNSQAEYVYYENNNPAIQHLKTMKGYFTTNRIYFPLIHNTKEVELVIDNIKMGSYFPDRNIVFFNYPIGTRTELSLGIENKVLFYLIEQLGLALVKVGMKEVDTKDYAENKIYDNFRKELVESLNNMRGRILDRKTRLKSYQQSELECLHNIAEYEKQVIALEALYKGVRNDLSQRVEEVRKLSFVKSVRISSRGIRVDYKHIDIEHKGEKIPLGECFVYINPNSISIQNKQPISYPSGRTYHSPHIEEDYVCWGSSKEKVFDLLASMKLKELTYLIYLYLKTVNTNDCYVNLTRWKEAKDNNGIIPDPDDNTDNTEEEDYFDGDDSTEE